MKRERKVWAIEVKGCGLGEAWRPIALLSPQEATDHNREHKRKTIEITVSREGGSILTFKPTKTRTALKTWLILKRRRVKQWGSKVAVVFEFQIQMARRSGGN